MDLASVRLGRGGLHGSVWGVGLCEPRPVEL